MFAQYVQEFIDFKNNQKSELANQKNRLKKELLNEVKGFREELISFIGSCKSGMGFVEWFFEDSKIYELRGNHREIVLTIAEGRKVKLLLTAMKEADISIEDLFS